MANSCLLQLRETYVRHRLYAAIFIFNSVNSVQSSSAWNAVHAAGCGGGVATMFTDIILRENTLPVDES